MAHYAIIQPDTMTITQVFVGRDENDLAPGITNWEDYYAPEGTICRRTSYNTRGGIYYDSQTDLPAANQNKAFRKNYAGIGHIYDPVRDAFIPPCPGEGWTLNAVTCLWEQPVTKEGGKQ
jgi:hypothetical protein